ncbi:MAG: enoyl-CoA hydratase/isomerase family protein [Bacteroidota bacterium]
MEYLNINSKGDYVIVQMNRPKVNAINFQMVKELRATFKKLQADDAVQGVILTGLPGVFSAGLDLIELYDYDEEKIRAFFVAFGSLHVEMVKFPKPFICAVTGHSPAGGTVFAITGDYRIMAEGEKFTLGLNEVAVNVQISTNLIYSYGVWLGRSKAYKHILAGKLLNNEEALRDGLVDEVVPMDQVLPRAEKRMQKYLQANPDILRNTKAKLRKDWWDTFDANIKTSEVELQMATEVWWSPDVRMRMQMFKAMLQSKKATTS